MMIRFVFAFSTAILFLISGVAGGAPLPVAPGFRVVIDPGHGGVDHGTVFDNGRIRIAEKDVTLAIAQLAAQKLRAKGFWAETTRGADQDLGLQARTAFANKAKADVFISIHMNSAASKGVIDAGGVETYILNHATDALSSRLAHFENTAIQSTGSTRAGAEAMSDNLDVELILKDLRLDANLGESKLLACALQQGIVAFSKKAPARNVASLMPKDRGVKQAMFYVLLGADMPSVLLEAGFLANSRDRAMVLSPEGREAISNGMVRAIEQYRVAKKAPQSQLALSRCKVH